jgi:hypothetical protein
VSGRKTPESIGRVVLDRFESQALRGNPHGDPHVRTIPVYLPPSYDASGDRYPVIFWCHGFAQTALWGVNGSPGIPSLPMCMDRIIHGGAHETILVMVDASEGRCTSTLRRTASTRTTSSAS